MRNATATLLYFLFLLACLKPSLPGFVSSSTAFAPLTPSLKTYRVLWGVCERKRSLRCNTLRRLGSTTTTLAKMDHHSGEEEGDAEKAEADEGFSLLNPEEKKYMEGWNEIMYSSLRRRNAVIGDEDAHFLPDPSMLPRDVITKVMTALMNNDEPCPDHGCAVVIRFSSDSNPVGEMEAAQLGRYFRSSDLRMMLLDANHFEFLDDLVTESNVNGEFALQDMFVEGLYESQLRLRWHLKKDSSSGAWLLENISPIRPGPI